MQWQRLLALTHNHPVGAGRVEGTPALLAGFILAAIRVLIALLIMLDILPMPPDMRIGWYLHHGGDQHLMFRLARGLVDGQPTREVTGLGSSLVMAVFIWLMDAQEYMTIAAPMVLVNGFLLGGLSVPILFVLTRHTTQSTRLAWCAALIWALAPLITYLLYLPAPRWLGFFVPKIGWLNGLSDPPAAFFFLLAVMLLSLPAPMRSRWLAVGLSLGIAVMFRIHLLFPLIFLTAYVLIAHGKRAAAWIALGTLIGYLPQAIYNLMVYKMPFTTGYISYSIAEETITADHVIANLPFHLSYLIAFTARHLPITLILAAVALIAGIVLWKRHRRDAPHRIQPAALMVGAPLSYLLPMLAAWPFANDPVPLHATCAALHRCYDRDCTLRAACPHPPCGFAPTLTAHRRQF